MAETNELAWLANATPTKTKFLATPRGRAPGSNPVEGHVKLSYTDNAPYSLSVPSQHAFKTERMLRRAALRLGYSLSVQVLKSDPEASKTTKDDVIPLKNISTLPAGTDVWISFHATEKTEDEKAADAVKAESNGSTGDPFQGTPSESAPAAEKTDAAPAAAKTPAVRKAVASK